MTSLSEITTQSLRDVTEGLAAKGGEQNWQLCHLLPGKGPETARALEKEYGDFPLVAKLSLASYYLSFLVLFFHKKGAVQAAEIAAIPELGEVLLSLTGIFVSKDPRYAHLDQDAPPEKFLHAWLRSSAPFSAIAAKDNIILDLLIRHDLSNKTRLSSRVMMDIRYLVHSLALTDEKLSREEENLLDFLARETAKVQAAIGDDSHFDPDTYGQEITKQVDQELLQGAMAELDELIGLESIKHEVKRLSSFLKIRKLRQEAGLGVTDITLHFVFKGNPGTGKTTVARILGKLFKGLGFLAKGEVVETDRSGLVAEYLGQTAVKTKKVAEEALDSILFVDEAYALSRGSAGGGSDNYGREAIETLLKFMEDNRRRLVVIVAGYPKLMDAFIGTNPGLKSRFTRYLEFNDFSPHELCRILQLFTRKADYRFTQAAAAALHQILCQAHDARTEGFGNARFARNLFEETVQNQAMRLGAGESTPSRDQLMTLEPGDLPQKMGELDFSVDKLIKANPWCDICPSDHGVCPQRILDDNQLVHNRTIGDWCTEYPQLRELLNCREFFWPNPQQSDSATALAALSAKSIGREQLDEAAARLKRFAPCIGTAFPETAINGGLIESPLVAIPVMQKRLATLTGKTLPGRLLLKCDNQLPISGSIKARGGIYEVLKLAETIARDEGLLDEPADYTRLLGEPAKALFSGHRISVGSTGNLGLSIGIMGTRLGFGVTVHMSTDAKVWKKELLQKHGVEVIEHEGDYGDAVDAGRLAAQKDPRCHFIDDEHSPDLFYGYGVAALRLQQQLDELGIGVDEDHPLLVYLPCGVGGGPGGITFGLKTVFGAGVHCFFAEPTHAPCMALGLMTGLNDRVSLEDFGIPLRTEADGLAVGRPSGFVCGVIENLVDGIFTVTDDTLFHHLALLHETEEIGLEPSAVAGMAGPLRLSDNNRMSKNATHLVWATGGGMVPKVEFQTYLDRGKKIDNQQKALNLR